MPKFDKTKDLGQYREPLFEKPEKCKCHSTLWKFLGAESDLLNGAWECVKCGEKTKTRLKPMGSGYEINIVEAARHQRSMRKRGFRFCPKCGRSHAKPDLGKLGKIKMAGKIIVNCDCGGQVKFAPKEEA